MAHDFDAAPAPGGERQIGHIGAPGARTDILPHLANSPYVLRYHPLRWQHIDSEHTADGGEWLPLLGQRTVSLGVNCTGADGNQAHANEYDSRHGWQRIDLRTTQDGKSYLRGRECAGGTYHYQRWETPRAVGTEVMASDVDTAGYYTWLRWLLAEGHIAPITVDAKRRCSQSQQHRISNIQRDARSNPYLADQLADEKKRLAAMLDEPKPPRSRRTSKDAA